MIANPSLIPIEYNIHKMAFTILNLCAAYVNSFEDAIYLLCMIRSWLQQVQAEPSELRIILHCGNDAVRKFLYKDALEKFMRDRPDLTVIEKDKRFSQIQGYKELLAGVEPSEDLWVTFTDADDLWSQGRMYMASRLIERITATKDPGIAKRLGKLLSVLEFPKYEEAQPISYDDVDSLRKEGKLVAYEDAKMELWSSVVRSDLACEVFPMIEEEFANFIYGDLLVDQSLSYHEMVLGGTEVITVNTDWVYFYRKTDSYRDDVLKQFRRGTFFKHLIPELVEIGLGEFAETFVSAVELFFTQHSIDEVDYSLMKKTFERELLRAGYSAQTLHELYPKFKFAGEICRPWMKKLREGYGIRK